VKIGIESLRRRLETFEKEQSGGWTFMETIIVIGIVLVLSSMVGFMAFKFIDQAKQASARSQIEVYTLALNAYYVDCKAVPLENDGLEALWMKPTSAPSGWNGPYINKSVKTDPWGNPYLYKVPGPNNLPFQVICYGADGKEGGEGLDKDITSYE
jgi:general secretion pathway protein G